jgi:hypothetical protein
MNRPHTFPHDFEALIRIFPPSEGGRHAPAFNGIRWDISYPDETPNQLYMVWPDFVDKEGESRSATEVLPVGAEIRAYMTVVADEMRADVHRQRIRVGTKFFCNEGPRRVAEGSVTKIVGLFLTRSR